MREGYDRKQVGQMLVTLREAMRALVARVTLTHDGNLTVAQNLLRGTYSGWPLEDVPAQLPMVMRDLVLTHDKNLDDEVARITRAFEMAEALIRQTTGYEDGIDEPELGPPSAAAVVLDRLRSAESAQTIDDLVRLCVERGTDESSVMAALRELESSGDIVHVSGSPAKYTAGLALDL